MARDLEVDDHGDIIVDPETHDFVWIDGIDEIRQRIETTLEIRYGEMEVLDPEQGMDYTDFLGKHFNKTAAARDLRETIMRQVREVSAVDNIKFTVLPNRKLNVSFTATATPTESPNEETIEGGVDVAI